MPAIGRLCLAALLALILLACHKPALEWIALPVTESECRPNEWCLALTVIDASTSESVEGAYVTVQGTTCEAMTSQSGRAHLECRQAGPVRLRVGRVGYTPVYIDRQVQLGRTYELTIRLARSVSDTSAGGA